jgi:hypothetical protein
MPGSSLGRVFKSFFSTEELLEKFFPGKDFSWFF